MKKCQRLLSIMSTFIFNGVYWSLRSTVVCLCVSQHRGRQQAPRWGVCAAFLKMHNVAPQEGMSPPPPVLPVTYVAVHLTQEVSHLLVLKLAVHLLPLTVMEGKEMVAGQRTNTGVFRCHLDSTAIGFCKDDKCAGSNKVARVVFEVRMKHDLLFGSNLYTATDGVKRSSSFMYAAVLLFFQRASAPFRLLWIIMWTDGDDYSLFMRSQWMHFKRHHGLLKTLLRDRLIYWQ